MRIIHIKGQRIKWYGHECNDQMDTGRKNTEKET